MVTLIRYGGDGYNHGSAHKEFLVDQQSDLSEISEFIAPGSVAYLADRSVEWVYTQEGAWTQKQASGGVSSVNGKTGSVVLTPSDIGIGTVFKLKGSKDTTDDLPVDGNEIGDVWYVVNESVGYIWLNDGVSNRWEQLGLAIDLSEYATVTYVANAINSAIGDALGGEY